MTGVIDAKLDRPPAAGLTRSRLIRVLTDPDGPGVVVVIAPPGSGKTTLLARAAGSTRSAWCTAGPEDRTGTGFLEHLTRALARSLGTDLGRPETAAQLVDAFSAVDPPPVLLALDDVHELHGAPAAAQLGELLRWRPRRLRVALGTRHPLELNTPRLMVSGDLVELDGEALRFRSWEVEELFRLVYDEPLSPEAAAALTRRTGGWAAGLKLFNLATSGKSQVERERAVAELGGRSRLLRSYLTRTVLDELDADRREFLLVTSTLGTLTGPLCDALLDRHGSAAVLEDLASRQFFTSVTDDGTSFRYHQVMQTLLEGLLVEEHGKVAAARIYARSAALLDAAGLLPDAARAYALAEDFSSVARLVQRSGAGLALAGHGARNEDIDDPWLALARARWLQRIGALDRAVEAFRHAESLLDDAEFRRRCAGERAAVALWSADGPRLRSGTRGAAPRTLSEAVRRVTVHVQEDPGHPHPLAEGIASLGAGDLAAARRALARVAGASCAERLFADLATAVVDLLDGSGERVMSRLEQLVLSADLADQPWVARTARGVQAAVLLSLSGDDWRVDSCVSLVEECVADGDDWGSVLIGAGLGTVLGLRRDPRADQWLRHAARGTDRLRAPLLQAWVETLRAQLARREARPEAPELAERARRLAKACGLSGAEPLVEGLTTRFDAAPVGVRRPGGDAGTPGIRVRCLGGFGIDVAGRTVRLPELRPLPRALLLLLALHHGEDVHREVLIDALWPHTTVDTAGHRLHAAASSLRKGLAEAHLGDDAVQRHGSAYRLWVGDAVLDVAEFEAALREAGRREARDEPASALACYGRALEAYQGDLLPETGPAEWVVAERDRLRVAAASAAYSAGRLILRLRSPEEALPAARRATELDPLRDSAWALLAEVQTQMGDVGSARATRREHDLVAAQLAGAVSSRAAPPPGARRAPA